MTSKGNSCNISNKDSIDIGYSLEFKLKAVNLYLTDSGSYKDVARSTGVAANTVKEWVLKYKDRGIDALKPKRILYSTEFKQKAINMILSGVNIKKTTRVLGVSSSSVIRDWYRKYKKDKILIPNYVELNNRVNKKSKVIKDPKSSVESDKDIELQKLRRENELLRMEIDIIKKLEALAQNKKRNIK